MIRIQNKFFIGKDATFLNLVMRNVFWKKSYYESFAVRPRDRML